jgi:hypothetical protein
MYVLIGFPHDLTFERFKDPFRPTAGSCRYNALRTAVAGVGQGGGSTSERARVDCTRDRPDKPLDDLELIAGLQQSGLPDRQRHLL